MQEENAFFEAARRGDMRAVKELIIAGVKVDCTHMVGPMFSVHPSACIVCMQQRPVTRCSAHRGLQYTCMFFHRMGGHH